MINFGLRNLELYFKDRSAVFLSFLAEWIIIILYILFLRDNLLSAFEGVRNIQQIVDVWMVAGLLGITSVTTTMGAYGTMIDDKVKGLQRDFLTTPIGRVSIQSGYLFSAVLIGLLMTFLMLLCAEVYLSVCYGEMSGAGRIFPLYCVIIGSAVSNASFVLLIVSFLQSSNALAACSTILGALIGFLTGIYLPMGSMADNVQMLVKCFPVSHSVVLYRQILVEPLVDESLGVDTKAASEFMNYMGIRYEWNGTDLSFRASFMVLLGAAACCLALIIIRQTIKRES